ncbi:MAG TPA: sigma-70 family RNA polymerase sigma factor, partial [Nakamurella sp.]
MTSVLDHVDSVVPSAGPVPHATRRSSSGHTIAAAPTGERAREVRDLLEYTVTCDDPGELRRCRQQVVTEYVPVARSLAGRYSGRGVERGDLEQLAYLGLVKAVQRWRPGRSDDFLQFAVPTIVGEIKRYFRDHSWLVRPPRRIQELRAAIGEAEQIHRHRDGSAATDAELAKVTGASAEDIGEARAAVACCRPRSLDEDQGP